MAYSKASFYESMRKMHGLRGRRGIYGRRANRASRQFLIRNYPTNMKDFLMIASILGFAGCFFLGMSQKGDFRKICFCIAMYFLGYFNAALMFQS